MRCTSVCPSESENSQELEVQVECKGRVYWTKKLENINKRLFWKPRKSTDSPGSPSLMHLL